MLNFIVYGFLVFQLYNAELTSYLTRDVDEYENNNIKAIIIFKKYVCQVTFGWYAILIVNVNNFIIDTV